MRVSLSTIDSCKVKTSVMLIVLFSLYLYCTYEYILYNRLRPVSVRCHGDCAERSANGRWGRGEECGRAAQSARQAALRDLRAERAGGYRVARAAQRAALRRHEPTHLSRHHGARRLAHCVPVQDALADAARDALRYDSCNWLRWGEVRWYDVEWCTAQYCIVMWCVRERLARQL